MARYLSNLRRRALLSDRIMLAMFSVILGLFLAYTDWLWRWDQLIYDFNLRFWQRPPTAEIIIVAIDEKSLAELGRWPWSRRLHAKMVDQLSAAGAKVIALNIIFAEPDATDPAGDVLLAQTIKTSGRVILPVLPEKLGGQLVETLPIPVLTGAVANLGHVDIELDEDGIVRRVYLKAGLGAPHWSSLGLAMLELNEPKVRLPLSVSPAGANRQTAPYAWVRDDPINIAFAGPPGHFNHIPYVDVLYGRFDPEIFHNKFVLVGLTATGLGQALPTPVSGLTQAMPGVEINAHILDTLLQELAIQSLDLPWRLLLTAGIVLLPALVYPSLTPRSVPLAAISLILLTAIASLMLLHAGRLWFPPAAPLVVLVISYPLWSFRRLELTARSLAEEKERAEMSEERFRQLAETIRDVFVVSNLDSSQIDYVSPAYEQLYGHSCNSLYENPAQWREAIHPEDRARVLAVSRDQAAVGEYDQQYRIVRTDGQVRWVRERAYPMLASPGRGYRLAGIIEDITEHQQIVEERELLNTIIEATPDIIGFADVNGRAIYLNQAGRQLLLSNAHDSVAGLLIADCHPPWAAELIANVGIPQAREHGTWVGESAILDSHGQEIPVSQVIMAHRSAAGELKYLSTIIHDISVFKRVETMIKATLAEKENLLREVHHRVKNNLQVILSLLDLQAEDIPNSLIRHKFIESCYRVRSMALVYERLYQSQDLVRIDFVEYVTSLTSYLLQSYLIPGCLISTQVDMAPVELNVETAIPGGLIINELVTNALKYAFVGRTTGHIRINLQTLSDNRYCLRVQDDGVGLPEGFDLNATHSFGLTVVMTLVRQLGATISLNTDQGTEFVITFTAR